MFQYCKLVKMMEKTYDRLRFLLRKSEAMLLVTDVIVQKKQFPFLKRGSCVDLEQL